MPYCPRSGNDNCICTCHIFAYSYLHKEKKNILWYSLLLTWKAFVASTYVSWILSHCPFSRSFSVSYARYSNHAKVAKKQNQTSYTECIYLYRWVLFFPGKRFPLPYHDINCKESFTLQHCLAKKKNIFAQHGTISFAAISAGYSYWLVSSFQKAPSSKHKYETKNLLVWCERNDLWVHWRYTL